MEKKKYCKFCVKLEQEYPEIAVYDCATFLIINDPRPHAKKHYLAITKRHFENLTDADIEDFETINEILKYVTQNKKSLGLENGFRIVINNGPDARQNQNHCHVHVLGGEELNEMRATF